MILINICLNLTNISWTVRVYSYGPTVRVWSDRTSIRIRSGPYAYGPNTHMVWNIYTQIQVNIKGSPVLSSIDFFIKDPSLFTCVGVDGLSIYITLSLSVRLADFSSRCIVHTTRQKKKRYIGF